ncbi:MAG: sugar isomerase domain-containing protein [Brevinema sp.]
MSDNLKKHLMMYYNTIQKNQQDIVEHEIPNIKKAAQIVVEVLKKGNKIWGYGPGHANEFIQALLCTPAGIPFINCLNAHLREVLFDNAYGLGELFAQQARFKAGDVLFFISISGRHPLPIEIIKYAQAQGVYTIGVTSVTYSNSAPPNNKWNARLCEVADLVFDNHVAIGDACVQMDGLEETVGAVSGVMSMFLAELLTAEIAQEMENQNFSFPVFRHPNLPENSTHNKQVEEQAKDWVNYFHL